MKILLPVALAAFGLGITSAAQAHDLWVTQGPGGEVMVQYGHPPKLSLPSAAKLLNFTALTQTGATPLVAGADVGGAPVLRAAFQGAGDAVVSASYDNGYWTQLKDGTYRNASKQMVPDSRTSMWSVK